MEDLDQEILRLLTGNHAGVTAKGLYSQSQLAPGRATLASALSRLRQQGLVVGQETGDGERVYFAAHPEEGADGGSVAARHASPQPAAPQPRQKTRRGDKVQRVRELLSLGEALMTRRQIAEQLNIPVKAVSDALCRLRGMGQAAVDNQRRWHAPTQPGQPVDDVARHAAPLPAAALQRPHANASNHPWRGPSRAAPGQPVDDVARHAAPLLAWRSDGVVELRRSDGTLEITTAELAALTQFATLFTGAAK